MAFDSAGNLYIADTNSHRVRKVDTNGVITTIAGDGTQGYGSDSGPAASARLRKPEGVAFRGGNLYIGDTDNVSVR